MAVAVENPTSGVFVDYVIKVWRLRWPDPAAGKGMNVDTAADTAADSSRKWMKDDAAYTQSKTLKTWMKTMDEFRPIRTQMLLKMLSSKYFAYFRRRFCLVFVQPFCPIQHVDWHFFRCFHEFPCFHFSPNFCPGASLSYHIIIIATFDHATANHFQSSIFSCTHSYFP